jgi:excisionase family DNA binding protein
MSAPVTRWVSVTDAAPRMGISREYVRVLIRSGALPAVKCGPARNSPWRVTEQTIAGYLDGRFGAGHSG